MRVLAVTESNDRPEVELYRRLAAAGHAVFVAHRPDWPAGDHFADTAVVALPLAVRHRLDFGAARALASLIRTHTPDVVYATTNRTLAVALAATRRLPEPAVVGYRGTTGHLSRWDPAAWMTYLHPRLDGIVCVSQAVERYLRRFHPHARTRTIYKGHDVAWYAYAARPARSEFGIPDGAFVVGFTGSLRPVKGIDVLLKAFARLPLSRDIHALLVGDVVDKRLAALAAAPALADRVHMTGYRTDAAAIAGICDAFVMPSIAREGLPRAVIEAMAQGVPPIVTRVGGLPELVQDGDCGIVIAPSDPGALADAILALAGSAETRHRLGDAARRRIRDQFAIDATVTELLAFFSELSACGRITPEHRPDTPSA